MKNDQKIEHMMNVISIAYADPEIKLRPDLQKILFDAAQELDKTGEYQLIAAKLCKSLSLYTLSHKNDFPKAANLLYNELKKEAVKYEAVALTAFMFPLWFP